MSFLRTVQGRLAVVAILLIPAIIYSFTTAGSNSGGNVVVREETLPAKIGDWSGKLEPLTDTELNILHSPSASQRIYSNSTTGDVVQVLLIQVENTQNAHDPRLCMAGSGYEETESDEVAAPWADSSDRNAVSHSVFSKEGDNLHMYYWMSTKTGTVANMSAGLKLEGMLRALRGEPTKGIAVRVLGRPNMYSTGQTPSPETLKALWQDIRTEIKLDDLIRRQ